MIKKSRELRQPDDSWQEPGSFCWLYNDNIFPSKHVFFRVSIIKVLSPTLTSVLFKHERISQEIKVPRNLLFPLDDGVEPEKVENLAGLRYHNRGEIFNVISAREARGMKYFLCGTDLFCIANMNSEEEPIDNSAEEMSELANWLVDETTVVPPKASPIRFIAQALRQHLITGEQMTVFITGAAGSGKTGHFELFMKFADAFNRGEATPTMQPRRDSQKEKQQKVESIIAANARNQGNSLGSLISKLSQAPKLEMSLSPPRKNVDYGPKEPSLATDGRRPIGGDAEARRPLYAAFWRELRVAWAALAPLTRWAGPGSRGGSAAVVSLLLETDEFGRFVGFRFAVEMLRTALVAGEDGKILEALLAPFGSKGSEKKVSDPQPPSSASPESHSADILRNAFTLDPPRQAALAAWPGLLRRFFSGGDFERLASLLSAAAAASALARGPPEAANTAAMLAAKLGLEGADFSPFFVSPADDTPLRDRLLFIAESLYSMAVELAVERANNRFREAYASEFLPLSPETVEESEPTDMTAAFDAEMRRVALERIRSRRNDSGGLAYEDLEARPALEVVDLPGFADAGAEGDNGPEEFLSNNMFEHFAGFFNRVRFVDEKRVFEAEGLAEHWTPLPFVSNEAELAVQAKLVEAVASARSPAELRESLPLPTFYKDLYKLLNLNLQAGQGGEGTLYVSVDHSFSSTVNYDLTALVRRGSRADLGSAFRASLADFAGPPQPEAAPSFAALASAARDFFARREDSATRVFFLHCLRIPKVAAKKDQLKELEREIEPLDFESMVERYRKGYPFSCTYDFFVTKFNLMQRTASINPHLNVDYKQLVSRVLSAFFGAQNASDFFLAGKTRLFFRENFYKEIESAFLKDTDSEIKSRRVFPFVEQAVRDAVVEHIDNSNKVISLAAQFLARHCGASPLYRFLCIQKRIVARSRRRRRRQAALELAGETIKKCLDVVPYIPLWSVVRIQAAVRGFLVRKAAGGAAATIRARRLRRNLERRLVVLATLTRIRGLTAKLVDSKLAAQRRLKAAAAFAAAGKEIFVRRAALETLGRALGPALLAFKLGLVRDRWQRTRAAVATIRRALKRRRLARAIQLAVQRRRALKEAADVAGINAAFAKSLASKGASLPLSLSAPSGLGAPVARRAEVAMNLVGITLWGEAPGLAACLAELASLLHRGESSAIRVTLGQREVVAVGSRGQVYVAPLAESRVYELRTGVKLQTASVHSGSVMFVEEGGAARARRVDASGSAAAFDAAKIAELRIVNNELAASTRCGKLLIKENLTTPAPPISFQFRRRVTRLAMGEGYVLAVDEGGLLYGQGDNRRGQLGLGQAASSAQLSIVSSLARRKEIVRGVACGESHSVVTAASGRIFGFGDNSRGQISAAGAGLFDPSCAKVPVELSPGWKVRPRKVQAACGRFSTFLLSDQRKLYRVGLLGPEKHLLQFEELPVGDKTLLPVQLCSEWNKTVELLYVRFLDLGESADQRPPLNPSTPAAALFDHFATSDLALPPYSDSLANFVALPYLMSKLVTLEEAQRTNKP